MQAEKIVFLLKPVSRTTDYRWDEAGEVKIYAMREYDEKNWSKRRYLPRLRWTEESWRSLGGSKVLGLEGLGVWRFKALRKWQKIWEFLKRKRFCEGDDPLFICDPGLETNGSDWAWKSNPTVGIWFQNLAAKSEGELTLHLMRNGREQSTTRVFLTARKNRTRRE